jgi:phospholipid-binding lipoprotein MlaA
MNRGIHAFNQVADKVVLKPIAKGYRAVVPEFHRGWVSNFFDNLAQPVHMLNALLQGQFKDAGASLGRFVTNTTFGFFGLFDVASEAGIPNPGNDFGQTLAKWGWDGDGGPFLMLPILGPSSVRDGIGTGVDALAHPLGWALWNERELHYGLVALDGVSTRERAMDLLDDLEKTSTDYYATLRTMSRQNRKKKINQVLNNKEPDEKPDYEADFSDIEWED